MLAIENSVKELHGVRADALPAEVLTSNEPVLLRGLVADWPIVRAAGESVDAADRYLRRFYRDATVGAFFAQPATGGRVFYNEDMTGLAYERVMAKLDTILDKIRQHGDDADPPYFYVGSTTVDTCLPGFRADNDVDFGDIEPLASIWLGNRARVAAHYDVPDNLACCAVGHRRFTLFPPEELQNLYVGPVDFTPAGQSISLVDFDNPDLERFPKFRSALEKAQVAEMSPGDAIFIPSMWWHHVESLDSLNVLINYWWRESPAYMGTPVNVLNHAFLSLRNLPKSQRQAWKNIFDYYIFEADEEIVAHIPEHVRGILSPIDETTARKLRADLLNKLNR